MGCPIYERPRQDTTPLRSVKPVFHPFFVTPMPHPIWLCHLYCNQFHTHLRSHSGMDGILACCEGILNRIPTVLLIVHNTCGFLPAFVRECCTRGNFQNIVQETNRTDYHPGHLIRNSKADSGWISYFRNRAFYTNSSIMAPVFFFFPCVLFPFIDWLGRWRFLLCQRGSLLPCFWVAVLYCIPGRP